MPAKMELQLSEHNLSSFFSKWVDNAVFSFAGHREARVWGLPLVQAAASTELWDSWWLDGKGRELIFYPPLKDRRQ